PLSTRIFSSTKSAESRQRFRVRALSLVMMMSERPGLLILALADLRLPARQEPADVLMVAEPDQHCQEQGDGGELARGDEPGGNGRNHGGHQGGQGGVA